MKNDAWDKVIMIEQGMHPVERRDYWALIGLAVLLVPLYFLLPFSTSGIYASPDETAAATVVRQLDWYGRITIPEPLAKDFPWMHPRSYVSQGESIAPVGFLGWPWIISVFSFILGQGLVPFLASLAALSLLFPLYGLLRPFGFKPAFAGTMIGMFFPAMILFGNRALFPQIGLLVLALWSLFFLSQLKSDDAPWKFGAIGFLSALALASRPTEIFWILPWFFWMGRNLRPDKKRLISTCFGVLLPVFVLGYLAQVSYGGFWKSGYMVKDNAVTEMISTSPAISDPTQSLLFPFGFHPRVVWWNVRSFLFTFLAPWSILLIVAGFLVARSKDKKNAVPLLALWTCVFLVGYYGHGLYTDHVQRGAVTIANSFVRYLLPLGMISALCWAYLMSRVVSRDTQHATRLIITLTLVLSGYGAYAALARDDEGLLKTRGELIRYVEIREQTAEYFAPTDLIVSERSDKIFFPNHRASLPPSMGEVARLAKAHPEMKIGLFARPLSQSQADDWRAAGFEPMELFVSGREKLYLLKPIQP